MCAPSSSAFNHTAASSLPEPFALCPHIPTKFALTPPFDGGADGRFPRYPNGGGVELLCSGNDNIGETPQLSGIGGGGGSGGHGDAGGDSIRLLFLFLGEPSCWSAFILATQSSSAHALSLLLDSSVSSLPPAAAAANARSGPDVGGPVWWLRETSTGASATDAVCASGGRCGVVEGGKGVCRELCAAAGQRADEPRPAQRQSQASARGKR